MDLLYHLHRAAVNLNLIFKLVVTVRACIFSFGRIFVSSHVMRQLTSHFGHFFHSFVIVTSCYLTLIHEKFKNFLIKSINKFNLYNLSFLFLFYS